MGKIFNYARLRIKYNTLKLKYNNLKEDSKNKYFNKIIKVLDNESQLDKFRNENRALRKEITKLRKEVNNGK